MKINLYSQKTKLVLRVLPIAIAFLMLMALRWVEYTFMPVVEDFHLTKVTRMGDYIVMQGYMRKVRNCRYIGVSAEGLTQVAKVNLPLKFLDAEKLSDNDTRPQGTQDWGPWRIVVPASPNIAAIDLYSVHACHLAWDTTTHLARVPLLIAQKRVE